MKAILFSIGTRGDIEPFLAIAQILKEKGWDILCVFPEQFRENVEEMDLEFKSLGKDFLALLDDEETKIFMGGQGSIFKRISILLKMSKKGYRLAGEMNSIQHCIQLEENADKIFYHPKCNYALIYGMLHPGKTIMVSPIPFMAHPINDITALGADYGTFINRLSFAFINFIKTLVLYKTWKKHTKNYEANDINLASIKKAMLQTEKTFYTVSPSLFPRPAYWPKPAQVVGYYERNKMMHWQPSSEISDFIARYPKIIFITFGSMSNTNPQAKTESIVQICKKHQIAAIINTSWGGLEKINNVPAHILFVNNVPYDWIFSKMYAIVHHGGSGTTHTALKYGCPSLIIPHIVDQFYWGRTMALSKLGPESIPIKKLTAETFEPKLLDLINNEAYKKNASNISKKMKEESSEEKLYQMILE